MVAIVSSSKPSSPSPARRTSSPGPLREEVLRMLKDAGYSLAALRVARGADCSTREVECLHESLLADFEEILSTDGYEALWKELHVLMGKPAPTRQERLIHKINTCRATRELYEKARATPHPITRTTGDWKFEFVSKDSLAFPNAQCDYLARTIQIDESLPEDLTSSHALFELTNAVNAPRIHAVYEQASGHHLKSGRQFAWKLEQIEDDGTFDHHEAVQVGIRENGWSASMDLYQHRISCGRAAYPTRWREFIKDDPHAKSYMEQYERIALRPSSPSRDRLFEIMLKAGFSEERIYDHLSENTLDHFEYILETEGEAGIQKLARLFALMKEGGFSDDRINQMNVEELNTYLFILTSRGEGAFQNRIRLLTILKEVGFSEVIIFRFTEENLAHYERILRGRGKGGLIERFEFLDLLQRVGFSESRVFAFSEEDLMCYQRIFASQGKSGLEGRYQFLNFLQKMGLSEKEVLALSEEQLMLYEERLGGVSGIQMRYRFFEHLRRIGFSENWIRSSEGFDRSLENLVRYEEIFIGKGIEGLQVRLRVLGLLKQRLFLEAEIRAMNEKTLAKYERVLETEGEEGFLKYPLRSIDTLMRD